MLFVSCAKAPPNLTPQATIAFQNIEIQKSLDLVRDIAQDGNSQNPSVISVSTTRKITLWHESALKILNARTVGWKITLMVGLNEVVKDMPQKEQQILSPYLGLVKELLK